ncbi:MAG: hypothetical protein WCC39_10180 [Telluria sp.]
MRYALALLAGLVGAPSVLAQSLPFTGRWVLDEGAQAQAPYTGLRVEGERLSWRGADKAAPGCVQEFVVKQERPGTVYVDGRGARFVAGLEGSLPTYLLQLRSSTCGGVGEDVRIRYPLVYDTAHIDVIAYAHGKPVSAWRFRRAARP